MQIHLPNSNQSELCDAVTVCSAAQPTKARLQKTWSDYIKPKCDNTQSKSICPNCSCFTCFLSIVVSRPVFEASHRGVIQECLVCTARHPAFIID